MQRPPRLAAGVLILSLLTSFPGSCPAIIPAPPEPVEATTHELTTYDR
jgi:hypothetical protein